MKKTPWLIIALRASREKTCALLALAFVRALALLAGAALTAHWLDGVFLRAAQLSDTAPVLLVLFFVLTAAVLVEREEKRRFHQLSADLRLSVRRALHARLLTPHERGETSVLTLALEAVDALDLWCTRVLPLLLSLVSVLPVLLLAACLRDPITAGLMLFTVPIAPFLLYLIGRVTKEASQQEWQRAEELSRAFSELLRTLPTLKLFGQASAQRSDVRRVSDAFSRAALHVLQLAFVSAFALELITTLSIAIIAVSIGLRLLYGQLTFETAFFLLLITPEFFQPLRQAGAAFHSAMTAAASEDLLRGVLGEDAPFRAPSADHPAAASTKGATSCPPPTAPAVAVAALSYTYPAHPLPALAGRSLSLAPGTLTVITGPSGCGKSTLLRVLAGLAVPYGGSVRFAGRELSSLSARERTRLISYVPQEPQIYGGTLAENITLFATVDAARLTDARRAAALAEGWDVPWTADQRLGDGGSGLSEGQRKRLGIARAFYQNRPLVLLDEPTAALDEETAERVRSALRSFAAGRTVLIATHDEALCALADQEIHWEVSS